MSTISEIRAERRADRSSARAEDRRDAEAAAERKHRDQQDRDARKEARRQRRAAKVRGAWQWVTEHPLQLAQVVLVLAPSILAFTAMAAYGEQIYGLVGLLLPGLTEVGMWTFSFARQQARRRKAPTFVLTGGLIGTMAAAAGMAYAHGAEASVTHGVVMAVVNVSGVLVHQALVHADRDKATPQQRRAARTARIATRRATAMERRAVRQAAGEVAADGSVQLVHRPGTVTLARTMTGRRRLVPTVVPGRPVSGVEDELDAELAALLAEGAEPSGTAKTPPAEPDATAGEAGDGTTDDDAELAGEVAAVREAIAAGELPDPPPRRRVQALLRVRASRAQQVVRALRDGDDGGDAEGVAA